MFPLHPLGSLWGLRLPPTVQKAHVSRLGNSGNWSSPETAGIGSDTPPTTPRAGQALMENEMKPNDCLHGTQVTETSRRTHVCGITSFRSRMTCLPFDARREIGRLRKTASNTQQGNEG